MKKLLCLFIASAILISCESNDDTDLDPIIGTWQLQSVVENGDEQTTECERRTTITFFADGTTNSKAFYDDGNGCESESDTSTWVGLENSTYKVDSDDEEVKLNFSQNNTVFTSSISETFNNTTYTTTITYKKI